MDEGTKTIQPHKLFKVLNVRDEAEAQRILQSCFGFLLYLQQGQTLETNTASFQKISHDLIYINPKIDLKKTVEALEKTKLIRIPV